MGRDSLSCWTWWRTATFGPTRAPLFPCKFIATAVLLSASARIDLLVPLIHPHDPFFRDLRRNLADSCQAQNSTRLVRLRPRRHSLQYSERVLWHLAWRFFNAWGCCERRRGGQQLVKSGPELRKRRCGRAWPAGSGANSCWRGRSQPWGSSRYVYGHLAFCLARLYQSRALGVDWLGSGGPRQER